VRWIEKEREIEGGRWREKEKKGLGEGERESKLFSLSVCV